MIDRIWRFERIPDTTGNLQCWKTVGLNYYDLPELGIHFSLIDGQDIVTVEELQILKRMVKESRCVPSFLRSLVVGNGSSHQVMV